MIFFLGSDSFYSDSASETDIDSPKRSLPTFNKKVASGPSISGDNTSSYDHVELPMGSLYQDQRSHSYRYTNKYRGKSGIY